MRVGATLNAIGWSMISEDLGMMETATAGTDVPKLWVLFETFFGKVDDEISVASVPSTTGHPSTFRAAKWHQIGGGANISSYTQIVPGPTDDEPGMNTISTLFCIIPHLTIAPVLFKIHIC